ncbi:MAG: hypothetical protein ACOH2L_19220 [Devosia sp.]
MSSAAQEISSTSLVYSIAELPVAFGVGMGVVRKIIRSGRLPIRELGRRRVVLREDALEYLRSLPVARSAGEVR